jgi:hypothetical protein
MLGLGGKGGMSYDDDDEIEYEIVTPENLFDMSSSPMFLWEFYGSGMMPSVFKGVEHRGLNLAGYGWWYWKDHVNFPYSSRSEIPAGEVKRGAWRRPLSQQQLAVRRAAATKKEPKSEAEALAEFFMTPPGKWKGWLKGDE